MTQQIAMAIQEHLDTRGVAVVIKARHQCMGARGVRKPDAEMVTSVMDGMLRDSVAARNEFLKLVDED